MAGERKGITYEAITLAALKTQAKSGLGPFHWNVRPPGMTINPDITVGNPNSPAAVLLVTHSGSASDSHKKMWRNLGELVEAKTFLSPAPKVLSIAFDAAIREDVRKIQEESFDYQLIVADEAYGPAIVDWVGANSAKMPADSAGKLRVVEQAMATTPGLNSAILQFGQAMRSALSDAPAAQETLWELVRLPRTQQAPRSRKTSLRRGCAKLLLLNDIDAFDKRGRVSKTADRGDVALLKSLGMIGASIAGPVLKDEEILWVLRSLDRPRLLRLHKFRTTLRLAEWIATLRDLNSISTKLNYLADHWDTIIQTNGMYAALEACHSDPAGFGDVGGQRNSKRVWLFHLIVEWIKYCGGSRTSFGRAKIVEEVAQLRADESHQRRLRAILAREPKWNAKRSVELGLTDWHSAASKQEFLFSKDDLLRVADVLALRLAQCPTPIPADDAAHMTSAVAQATLNKIVTYFKFRPLNAVVTDALNADSGDAGEEVNLKACFAEAALANGGQLDPRSGGTRIQWTRNTLVKWQSATDAGKEHKKKELCGRAVAMKFSFDPVMGTYSRRSGVEKLILVADGTWTDDDLDALIRAGWDEIFYPDEMDKLAAAIV